MLLFSRFFFSSKP